MRAALWILAIVVTFSMNALAAEGDALLRVAGESFGDPEPEPAQPEPTPVK